MTGQTGSQTGMPKEDDPGNPDKNQGGFLHEQRHSVQQPSTSAYYYQPDSRPLIPPLAQAQHPYYHREYASQVMMDPVAVNQHHHHHHHHHHQQQQQQQQQHYPSPFAPEDRPALAVQTSTSNRRNDYPAAFDNMSFLGPHPGLLHAPSHDAWGPSDPIVPRPIATAQAIQHQHSVTLAQAHDQYLYSNLADRQPRPPPLPPPPLSAHLYESVPSITPALPYQAEFISANENIESPSTPMTSASGGQASDMVTSTPQSNEWYSPRVTSQLSLPYEPGSLPPHSFLPPPIMSEGHHRLGALTTYPNHAPPAGHEFAYSTTPFDRPQAMYTSSIPPQALLPSRSVTGMPAASSITGSSASSSSSSRPASKIADANTTGATHRRFKTSSGSTKATNTSGSTSTKADHDLPTILDMVPELTSRCKSQAPDVMPGEALTLEATVERVLKGRNLENDGLIDKSTRKRQVKAAAEDDEDFDDGSPPFGTQYRTAGSTGPGSFDDYQTSSNKGKTTMEMAAYCSMCQTCVAKLTLRGADEEFNVRFFGEYVCYSCDQLSNANRQDELNVEDEDVFSDKATYADTLSGTVDKLVGIPISPEAGESHAGGRPPPTRLSTRNTNRKRSMAQKETLVCTACSRLVAFGDLRASVPGRELTFGIEALCRSCSEKYQRCSDCGGSAGPKLGVGKFRCRELFAEGRKTCKLSHVRLGSPDDIVYDVWPINELPADELEDLIAILRSEYAAGAFGVLAVPETLEAPGSSVARTFEHVRKLVSDTWAMFEALVRRDIEDTHQTRRYLGLRWSKPMPRKKKQQAKRKSSKTDSTDDVGPAPETTNSIGGRPGSAIRSGRLLAGFCIAEADLPFGSVFLPLTVPTGIGEIWESTNKLLRDVMQKIQDDVQALNVHRQLQSLPVYPKPNEAWMINIWRRDLRSWTRRGFVHLKEYLEEYPDTESYHFAPFRPVFVPNELLKGWSIYVRRVEDPDDLLRTAIPKRPNRSNSKPAIVSQGGRSPSTSKTTITTQFASPEA